MCLEYMLSEEELNPSAEKRHLHVLLTNGRFPVTIDLARQFHAAGFRVYVVDPMEYHVCKFSNAVRKSYYSPAPIFDAPGYLEMVRKAIKESKIDIIVPMHEEIFYLATCGDREILDRLFAPPAETLLMLHDKWTFGTHLQKHGLDAPNAFLIKSMDDVKKLDLTTEWALKPIFGRASSKVYHLVPGEPLPDDCDVAADNHYVAQEWMKGARYCTYTVVVKGVIRASVVYPVQDTIDGSSCVYFEAVEHNAIQAYIAQTVAGLGIFNGQLAFDFIDTAVRDPNAHPKDETQNVDTDTPGRLVAIECNPRATSGIHLWSGTPHLAHVFAASVEGMKKDAEAIDRGEDPNRSVKPPILVPRPTEAEGFAAPFPHGAARQVAPGMLMSGKHARTTWSQYFKHMKHLVTTKDATFSWSDIGPTLMQPFLLTSYYEICRERGGMRLADMFQSDLVWEPQGVELENARRLLARFDPTEERVEDYDEKEKEPGHFVNGLTPIPHGKTTSKSESQ